MRLLLGTNNAGKRRELQALLGAAFELLTPHDIGLSLEIDETGTTYHENAALKAHGFAQASGLPTLADDSGLEVDALGGAPGVFSARFSPRPGASDADRRALLVSRLQDAPQPWTARFRCVIALADASGWLQFSEGVCEGQIIGTERGQQGFGYDPIFLFPELGRTMAELSTEEKNQRSHRALATRQALPILQSRWPRL